uniref:Uncharacterized protein n=1 Tax=Vibrio tasmaniensis TaxID=212663 RepID=A0A0H4A1T2_9VIBR|nr:hypothetical protein [Vibrio tasmaniensis]AKN36976.1 hypothetical protein [Vibrio tasmaniensis]AKN36987.1 hypothetical protein [Vibrio tasmaniensis]AKN39716.1 hypothetical protein [Vibrio tasmaniensis]AKN40439.1 hypothetical protein [Vibrio tasmaniensis]
MVQQFLPSHTMLTRSYSPETKSFFSSLTKRGFDFRRPNQIGYRGQVPA